MAQTLLFAGVLSVIAVGDVVAADGAEPVDQRALALLRAVENARLGVVAGKLDLDTDYRTGVVHNKSRYTIVFDGDRRRFDATEGKSPMRSVFTPTDLIHYDGVGSCTLRDPKSGLSEYCFDPRTLGITGVYLAELSVPSCLRFRGAKSVGMIGEERISGHSTTHVRVEDAYGQLNDFWIDQAEGFPVHRYEFALPGGERRSVVICQYDKAVLLGTIPVEVSLTGYDAEGNVDRQCLMRVLSVDLAYKPDSQTWKLTGLELPVGTPVTDLRLKQRIGYWDGKGLSKQLPVAMPTRRGSSSESYLRWPFFVVGGIAIGAILIVLVRGKWACGS